MKKEPVKREALWVHGAYHDGLRYLAYKGDTPMIQLTQDALDQYLQREIGPDWREKTQMDN